jgi:hypothetical protein
MPEKSFRAAILVAATAALLLHATPPAPAQEPAAPRAPRNEATYSRGAGWNVTLEARAEPLPDVLKRVEKMTGVRVTLEPASAGWEKLRVDLRITSMPLADTLRLIVRGANPGLKGRVPQVVSASPTAFRIVARGVDAVGLPDTTVSGDFRDVPLWQALEGVLAAFPYSVSLSDSLKGNATRVTASFRDVPVRQAVETLLVSVRPPEAGTAPLDFQAVRGQLWVFRRYDRATLDRLPDVTVNVEMNLLPARQALELLARSAGLKVVVSVHIGGVVTYSCKDKKFGDALLEVLAQIPRHQWFEVRYFPPAAEGEAGSLVVR